MSLGDGVRLEGVGQGLETAGHVLEGRRETARGRQGQGGLETAGPAGEMAQAGGHP